MHLSTLELADYFVLQSYDAFSWIMSSMTRVLLDIKPCYTILASVCIV